MFVFYIFSVSEKYKNDCVESNEDCVEPNIVSVKQERKKSPGKVGTTSSCATKVMPENGNVFHFYYCLLLTYCFVLLQFLSYIYIFKFSNRNLCFPTQ